MSPTRRKEPYESQIGQYAGFITRLLALIIDIAIIGLILLFSGWFITSTMEWLQIRAVMNQLSHYLPAAGKAPDLLFSPVTASLVSIVFIFSYHVFFVYTTGQTPGKAIMGVRVAHFRGSRKSLWRAILRYLGYFVSGIPLGMGFLWILIDDRRQGWHDKIAGTCVIYTWEARPDETFLVGPIQALNARRTALKNFLARRRGQP